MPSKDYNGVQGGCDGSADRFISKMKHKETVEEVDIGPRNNRARKKLLFLASISAIILVLG